MQGRLVEIDLRSQQVLWEYENTHEVGEYLESRGETPEEDFATFGLSAGYYVGRPSFLVAGVWLIPKIGADEPRSQLGQGARRAPRRASPSRSRVAQRSDFW
jgi:hypothetical protein